MKLFKAMLCSVAALSLLLPAAHAQAAPTVVKIALTQPTGHPTTDLIRGQFKKTIEEKTNGRFRIDVFDNYSDVYKRQAFILYGSLHLLAL